MTAAKLGSSYIKSFQCLAGRRTVRVSVIAVFISNGRLFHTNGPVTEKLRGPKPAWMGKYMGEIVIMWTWKYKNPVHYITLQNSFCCIVFCWNHKWSWKTDRPMWAHTRMPASWRTLFSLYPVVTGVVYRSTSLNWDSQIKHHYDHVDQSTFL